MDVTNPPPPDASSESRERKWVWLLCCLAAIHVFIFSAAFPFFNNVDEPIHFDLVVKYSHGHVPQGRETLSVESAIYLSLYSSLAYWGTSELFPHGKFPAPPWKQPLQKVRRDLAIDMATWHSWENYEASQPPLYYTLAGLWWDLGKGLGIENGRLLYWVRVLNILVIAALGWVGYATARLVFPANRFVQLGVPTLLAFMPQTAFYSIENDVLSPLCFGLAFICLIKLLQADLPGIRLGILTGLVLATTFLTKMTNLPLLAVSVAVVAFKTCRLARSGRLRPALPALGSLALCAVLPAASWMAWSKHAYGDFTGAALKMHHLHWTLKPFAEWWTHPIFTPHGLWTFLSGNLETFWQGEFTWHRLPLASRSVDMAYVFLSIVFTGVALLSLKALAPAQRRLLWLAFACFGVALAFFGFLSIIYDFHTCPNPSREHPYFTSGRLILGASIPFLLLYVYGLDRVLQWTKVSWIKPVALSGLVLFMVISEIVVDWPAFSNPFNWFHL